MLPNITELLRCGPQRVSKDASCLLHLFYAIHSPSTVSLLPCVGHPLIHMEKLKMELNLPPMYLPEFCYL